MTIVAGVPQDCACQRNHPHLSFTELPPNSFKWMIFKLATHWSAVPASKLNYIYMRCRQNSIAAKWNIFLSFGLKAPFGFPCFAHVCLESWFGLVFFSTAYVTLVVALLFGGLVLLLAFLQGFFNRFLSLRCSTVTLLEVGALACFYEWMDSVSDFATYAWLHFLPGQSTCCKF